MTAVAASQLQGAVINNAGAVDASSITSDGGVIRLTGADEITNIGTLDASSTGNLNVGSAGNLNVGSTGNINIGGTGNLSVDGTLNIYTGGTLNITGNNVILNSGSGTLNVSGQDLVVSQVGGTTTGNFTENLNLSSSSAANTLNFGSQLPTIGQAISVADASNFGSQLTTSGQAISVVATSSSLTPPPGASVNLIVSVHSPLPFPGNAAILAPISAGETPALPGGSERLPDTQANLPNPGNGASSDTGNGGSVSSSTVVDDTQENLPNPGNGASDSKQVAIGLTRENQDFNAGSISPKASQRYNVNSSGSLDLNGLLAAPQENPVSVKILDGAVNAGEAVPFGDEIVQTTTQTPTE